MQSEIKNHESRRQDGFVILFAITLTSIILAISLGVANITLKEANFTTSGRATNDAFFAADTGADCALLNDKSTSTSFIDGGSGTINCLNSTVNLVGGFPSWDFVLTGLGASGTSCAKVNVTKDNSLYPIISTEITSKGYNLGDSACNSSSLNRVERELKVTYDSGYATNYALGRCAIAGACTGVAVSPHTIDRLTDGNYTTLAYPGGVSFSYEIDLGQSRFISIINAVLCRPTHVPGDNGCYGYDYQNNPATPYINSWQIATKLNAGDAYTNLDDEGIPNVPGRNIILHPNQTMRYIKFSAQSTANWIGTYELEAYGN